MYDSVQAMLNYPLYVECVVILMGVRVKQGAVLPCMDLQVSVHLGPRDSVSLHIQSNDAAYGLQETQYNEVMFKMFVECILASS